MKIPLHFRAILFHPRRESISEKLTLEMIQDCVDYAASNSNIKLNGNQAVYTSIRMSGWLLRLHP